MSKEQQPFYDQERLANKVEDLYNAQIDKGKDVNEFVGNIQIIVEMISQGVKQNPDQNNNQE